DDIDITVLKRRLLGIQALESARCVEERVVTDVREADVGSILGFGFAPFTGGTISYIDGMGVKNFVQMCNDLAKACGERFKPSKLLVDMANKGETFYGRFAPTKRKAVAKSMIAKCGYRFPACAMPPKSLYLPFDASAGEARSDKIMLKQKAKAKSGFDFDSVRFSFMVSPCG